MKYTVYGSKALTALGIVGEVIFAALFGGLLWFRDPANPSDWGLVLLAALMLGAVTAYLYCTVRPRVLVDGGKATCYPRWKKKRTVVLSSITSKKTTQGADNAVLTFGALGYAVSGGQGRSALTVTYYAGEEAVLRLHTQMRHADWLMAQIEEEGNLTGENTAGRLED